MNHSLFRRLALLLILLLVCAFSSSAPAEEKPLTPDDTYVFRFTFTSSEGAWARVGLRYDHTAFRFISAEGAQVNPNDEYGYFILGNGVSAIGSAACSVTFKVTHEALGDYTFTPYVEECFDVNTQDVTGTVTGASVTVSPVDPAGLGFGAYVPATDTSNGLRGMIICTRCGKTLVTEQVIPAGSEICIPSSVSVLTEAAFANTAASQLRISEGVTAIAEGVFAGCDSLLLVILPDSLTSIAEDAFTGCANTVFMCSAANTAVRDWAAAHGIFVKLLDQ